MIRIPSPNIGLTKSYPLLFILSVRQLHRFHLPRNQSKTRRSIPVYLHFHILGPDNDPSVYSQYPPLAGAVLIGAITTHRMQKKVTNQNDGNFLKNVIVITLTNQLYFQM